MELKQEIFEFEGVKYVIRRLTTLEKSQIIEATKANEREGNLLAVKCALVEPKLTLEEIKAYDSVHTDYITIRLAIWNKIPDFLGVPLPTSS